MTGKTQCVLLFVVLISIASWMAFWPLVQAQNEYSVATETFDSKAKCAAAGRIALAWARLGFSENTQEWRETEFYNCRYANVQGH